MSGQTRHNGRWKKKKKREKEREKSRNPRSLKKGHSRRTIHFGQDFHSRRRQKSRKMRERGGRGEGEEKLVLRVTLPFTLCLSPRLPFSLFRNAYLRFPCGVCLYAADIRRKRGGEKLSSPLRLGFFDVV